MSSLGKGLIWAAHRSLHAFINAVTTGGISIVAGMGDAGDEVISISPLPRRRNGGVTDILPSEYKGVISLVAKAQLDHDLSLHCGDENITVGFRPPWKRDQ